MIFAAQQSRIKNGYIVIISVLYILANSHTINAMMVSDKDRQLVKSIKNENFEQAIDLLNTGANPNTVVEDNDILRVKNNAFEDAVMATRYVYQPNKREALDNLIKTFIAKGANIHQQSFDGDTLLFGAFSLQAVKAFVEAGADINHKNMHGVTPLRGILNETYSMSELFKQERCKIIDYLVSKGAK